MQNEKGKIYFGIGLDNDQLRADAAQSSNILKNIGNTAASEGDRIDTAINRIGKTIVGVFSIQQAANFARQIINVRGEIESLQKSFETLAGKEQGAKLFSEIKDFAVNTPMMMNDIAKGAQTLLAFNTEAEEVMPILRAIGDISMGDAQKFNSLTLAFSQMSSTGKLMGQDFQQMINAGFNPLSVIAEKTGKSIGELKDEMSAGAISAEAVKQAFIDATSAGGKFYNMLETQSKGIQGSISNLQGAFDDMLNSIGENTQGIITGSIQVATDLVKNYEKLGKVIAELIATYGVYRAALIAINALKALSASTTAGWTVAELAHYKALLLVEKAQKALNATMLKNPYILAAAAVAALAYGIYKLVTAQTDAEKAQARLNKTTSNMNKEIAAERVQIDSLFARLKAAKEGTDGYQTAKQAIINQYGDYLKGLGNEIESLKDVEAAYKAVKKAAEDAAKARAIESSTKEAADDYAQKVADVKDDIYSSLKRKFGDQKDNDGMSLVETYYWQVVDAIDNGTKLEDDFLNLFDSKQIVLGGATVGSIQSSAEYNPIKTALGKVAKAQDIFDKTIAEAQRRFGDAPKLSDTSSEDDTAVQEVVKNKKYWEEYLKEQQGLLDAMTSAQLQTDEARKIRKNIVHAQTQIDAYGTSKSRAGGDKTNDDLSTIATERNQQLQKYAEDVSKEARQAEFDIAQAKIDAMEEGLNKELAQNELNYKRLIDANIRRREEMVERLRDIKETEWENANPNAKKQGLTFDRSTITEADLPADQVNRLVEYARIATEAWQLANRDSLRAALDDIETYEQQRTKITEEYERKRKALYDDNGVLRKGIDPGNLDELKRNEEEALKAVDQKFASRETTYLAWINHIANYLPEALENVLKQVEEELAALEKSGSANSQQMAVARAKVATARDKAEKARAETDMSLDKRTLKEWEDLYKTLQDVSDEFSQIGDSVDGLVGDIIKTAGTITASAMSGISSITKLAQWSIQAEEMAAQGASTAIVAVEKASVILTVISAAMQIATTLATLFKKTDYMEEFRREVSALNNELELLQINARIDNKAYDTIFGDDPWRKSIENIDAARDALERYNATLNDIKNRQQYSDLGTIIYSLAGIKTSFDSATASIANMDVMIKERSKVGKFFGLKDKKTTLGEAVPELFDANGNIKMDALETFIGSDTFNRLSEDNQEYLKRMSDDWKTYEEAMDAIKSHLTDIFGELGSTMTDALVDAFENGTDAAQAFTDSVSDMLRTLAKQLVYSVTLGPLIEQAQERMLEISKNENLTEEERFKAYTGVITDLMDDGLAKQEEANRLMSAINEIGKQKGIDIFSPDENASREASTKGIATASQDTVDELNGRATAIQGHTYSIMESSKLLVANSSRILEHLAGIEDNTKHLTKLENIEGDMKTVKNTVNDIALKGIKLKSQ